MADNKFSNLNARIYQGHDPNTEFKETGTLLSTARFADSSSQGSDSLPQDTSSSTTDAGGIPQNFFSPSENQSSIQGDQAAPFLSNSTGGSSMSSSSSNDASSQLAPSSQDGYGVSGNQAQGSQSSSAPSANSFAAASDPGPGSPSNTNAAPAEDPGPHLDAPIVTVQGSVTNEGDPIALSISVTVDQQPDVTTTLILGGVPADATLSAGIHNSDGTWTLTPDQLTGLILTPDPHSSGEITLSVTAVSRLGDLYSTDTENFKLTINETVVTPPTIVLDPIHGMEDTPVHVDISSTLSANVTGLTTIIISSVPTGASLSAGTNNHDGSWTLSTSQLTNLTLTPPSNFSGDLNLSVEADGNDNGTHTSTTVPLTVSILGIADMPLISVAPASGNENTPISLSISAALTDTDGSETLSIMIFNVPNGASLSAGTDNGDGSWTLTPLQASNLKLIPPSNFSGSITLDVLAQSHEGNTNAYADTQLVVTVNHVVDAPILNTSPASGNEDTSIALNISSSIPNGSTGVLSVTVSGVPTGASLSAGTNNGNGTWTLTPSQLTNLTISPPHDYSGDFNLSVKSTLTDNGVHNDTISTLAVHVAGVPNVPTLNVQSSSGEENTAIHLNINAALTDTDGSETLSVTISGVPTGAVLSAGIDNHNGTWTLTSAQLANLTITPPAFYSGNFTLGVVATASENNLSASTSSTSLGVVVGAVADTPTLNVHAVSGNEDTPIALGISAALTDNDGSETLTVTVAGLPTGATLSAGDPQGNGSWLLTPAQLTNLTITPPLNYSGNIVLTVSATSAENGTTSQVTQAMTVTVNGVADAPTLNIHSVSGNEHSPIALQIGAALTDTDGSETLSIQVSGVPAGATLSAGTNNGGGVWTLTPAQLTNLTMTPPTFFSGNINLGITAKASENGTTAQTTGTLQVSVAGVADAPTLNVHAVSGDEDSPIALQIGAALVDTSGGETLSVQISGVPTGASLSAGTNNGGGVWTLTPAQLANVSLNPPSNYSGNINLSVTATSSQGATTAQTTGSIQVTVNGVADAPTLNIHTVSGNEHTPIALQIGAALSDTDGSETLSIQISGVPTGAVLSAGTNNGGGVWTLTPAQLTNLTLTPPTFFTGNINLGVTATASENGTTEQTTGTMQVSVGGVADAPTLNIHAVTGNEDSPIALQIGAALVDTSGGETLSVQISGVPTGATLSAGTNNGGGIWTLTAAQLTNLSLNPPSNYSGNINLNVTATSSQGGTTAQTSGSMQVTVNGVADTPTLNVHAVSGSEDSPIALQIGAALTDTDGSEILSAQVTGVPIGATLSAGINNGGGVWTLTAAQLANLSITPPANYSGNFTLGVTATASENGTTAQTSGSLQVTVNGVADAPALNIHTVTGNEDSPIALQIGAALTDTDGSETLSVSISGVPTGATLSAGTNNGGGNWTLTASQLTNLTLTPPANYSGGFNLGVTATSSENGTTAQTTGTMHVNVNGVADTPNLTVQAATGAEDTGISLNIAASVNDNDGSELLSVVVAGVPTGAFLSAGLNNGNGSWTLSPSELTNLKITPAVNFAGNIALTVTAVSTETNGDTATKVLPLGVTVTGVADAPTLTVAPAIGKEDTAIALNIAAALTDTDGSETLSIKISGVPTGATLSAGTNNGSGNWTLNQSQLTNLKITPPLNSSADFVLSVTATSTETANGSTSPITASIPVTVLGSADIPTVNATNTTGAKNTAVSVNISGAVTDTDGSETITYLIGGVPDGFSLNHGNNNGNNTWTLKPSDLSGLTITSPYNFEGKLYLTARSVSHDDDNSTMQSLPANFNVGIGNPLAATINLGVNLGIAGIGVGTTLGADVNTGGLLSPGGIVVHEDAVFPLLDANLLLGLASGIAYVSINGLPAGATLSSGVSAGAGVWQLTPADLMASLSLRLPPNSDQDFTLSITAKLLVITVVLATVDVHVLGVADMPTLSVANATGLEDAASVHINVTSALTDTDGSETLSFMVKDLPSGFTPTVGVDNGDGTWSLTAAQIANLDIKPPADFSGDATFTIVAVSTEREGDSIANTTIGHIHIDPVADAPVVAPVLHNGIEDTPMALNLGIALKDTDGSESITAVTISGLATGFSLTGATNNGNGTWSVDPSQLANLKLVSPTHWSGDTTLTVTATSREGASGPTASTTTTLNAHIDARADSPTLSVHDATGIQHSPIALNISSGLTDNDGSEHLSVVISNVPDHFAFSTGLNNGNGSWSFTESQLHNLTVTSNDFSGDAHFSVDAFAQESSNHTIATTHADLTVHVTPDT